MLKQVVRPGIYGDRAPLAVSAYHVYGEPISAADARIADYGPFEIGQAWAQFQLEEIHLRSAGSEEIEAPLEDFGRPDEPTLSKLDFEELEIKLDFF